MKLRSAGMGTTVLACIASAAAYGRLPARVPIHWGLDGRVDGWASRGVAAAAGPLLVLATWGTMELASRFDPRSRARRAAGDEPAGSARETVMSLPLWFLAAVHVAIMAAGVGLVSDLRTMIVLGLGAMLAAMGNVMGRVRPNGVAGIRTRWTLGDDEVWRRTHRMAGRAMVAAGVAIVGVGLTARASVGLLVAVALTLGAMLVPAAWSGVVWKQVRGERF